jgi:hypothetical protein
MMRSLVLVLLACCGVLETAATAWSQNPQAVATIRALSTATHATAAAREKAVVEASLADLETTRTKTWVMNGWVAQMLILNGREKEGLLVTRDYIKMLRRIAQTRIDQMEEAKRKGTWKPGPTLPNGLELEQPHINGFGMYSMMNVYMRYRHLMDQEMLDDFQWVFTMNTHYKGTTGNLAFLIPFNLYMAEKYWDSSLFNPHTIYGARGPQALAGFQKRIEYVASRGSPEFASRPYMLFNMGTLLSLDNDQIDEETRRRAVMAYELSVIHCAGTWLRGNLATPAGRSYPPYFGQVPSGGAEALWFYFGGMTPSLGGQCNAIFAVAEPWRPHPLIVNAATDRSEPYVHRSRFDGQKMFQTSFVNRSYAVFSTATVDRAPIWGQTYPYGVMFDQPDRTKASICWMTVPVCDDRPLTNHTYGVRSRFVEYQQHRGSLLLVANQLRDPKMRPAIRPDVKGHEVFTTDGWYVLAYVPAGYQAMINDSAASGHVFLDYGSVLIAFSSPRPFAWDPAARVFAGRGGLNEADSEFRIFGDDAVLALETAHPDEFRGSSPARRLTAFKEAILAKSRVELVRDPENPEMLRGTYRDRFGAAMDKTWGGAALIDGAEVDYRSWPLVDNPWIHQEWDGPELRLTDGKTERIYDVKEMQVVERPVAP